MLGLGLDSMIFRRRFVWMDFLPKVRHRDWDRMPMWRSTRQRLQDFGGCPDRASAEIDQKKMFQLLI